MVKRKISQLFEKGDKVVVNANVIFDKEGRKNEKFYATILKSASGNYYRLVNPIDKDNKAILD